MMLSTGLALESLFTAFNLYLRYGTPSSDLSKTLHSIRGIVQLIISYFTHNNAPLVFLFYTLFV